MIASGKRIVWLVFGVFTLIGLVVLHGKVDAHTLLSLRLATLFTVLLGWRHVVDALTAGGWVHPLRRSVVIASRWRVLGLVAMLEIFVIQQVPRLLIEIVRL